MDIKNQPLEYANITGEDSQYAFHEFAKLIKGMLERRTKYEKDGQRLFDSDMHNVTYAFNRDSTIRTNL